MVAVVSERKKEIALKKAIGASQKNIIMEFLGENIVLGVFGGLFGSLAGFLFAQIISVNVFTRSISFQVGLIPLTILLSTIITVFASLIPIKNTITIEPAIVLKGE
jgi:putative ABC transport system permease protein